MICVSARVALMLSGVSAITTNRKTERVVRWIPYSSFISSHSEGLEKLEGFEEHMQSVLSSPISNKNVKKSVSLFAIGVGDCAELAIFEAPSFVASLFPLKNEDMTR